MCLSKGSASFISNSRRPTGPMAPEGAHHSWSHRLRPTGLQAIYWSRLWLMNLQNDPQSFALMKFGIGQPVPRSEDPTLVRGEGCYTDDIKLAGEAYAVMVRSRVPHGVIKSIDTSSA